MGAVPSQIESLYSEKFRSLVGFAQRRLPRQIDAEDVVQASFLKILERADIDTLDVPASYLMAVVKNEVIAQLRAESSMERKVDRAASLPVTAAPDPTDVVEEAEIARVAATATETLPLRQKRILAKYLSGMTPSEIADSESTAQRRVHANQISSLLTRTSRKLQRTMGTRGLLSAAPLAHLRRRLRELLVRLHPSGKWIQAQTLMVACALTLGQLGLNAAGPITGGDEVVDSPRASQASDLTEVGRKVAGSVHETAVTSAISVRSVASTSLLGRQRDLIETDETDTHNPSVTDQIVGLVQDPSQIPLPECGGLPACR